MAYQPDRANRRVRTTRSQIEDLVSPLRAIAKDLEESDLDSGAEWEKLEGAIESLEDAKRSLSGLTLPAAKKPRAKGDDAGDDDASDDDEPEEKPKGGKAKPKGKASAKKPSKSADDDDWQPPWVHDDAGGDSGGEA